ncbi:MAG TPA: hypothetical protein VGI17_05240 [Solirubrobacterales bacterium]
MREKLNSNPFVQMGLIAVLLVVGAIFLLSTMGGGGSEESGPEGSLSASSTPPGQGAAPTPGVTPAPVETLAQSVISSRPLPRPVLEAWKSDRTVALLFIHDGGIDDDLVKHASTRLDGMSDVSTFVVPASKIARYSAITEAVGVERVPALVVLQPKRLDPSGPTASVTYGFQSDASIVQAVINAAYKGPTVEYHP